MSTSQHSPLPWHHYNIFEGHCINDVNRHHVAYCDWSCEASDTETAPASHNAALIVQACNAFHPLLAAAEAALAVFTDLAIDLDGDAEAALASVRLQLHEAISAADSTRAHTGSLCATSDSF